MNPVPSPRKAPPRAHAVVSALPSQVRSSWDAERRVLVVNSDLDPHDQRAALRDSFRGLLRLRNAVPLQRVSAA